MVLSLLQGLTSDVLLLFSTLLIMQIHCHSQNFTHHIAQKMNYAVRLQLLNLKFNRDLQSGILGNINMKLQV